VTKAILIMAAAVLANSPAAAKDIVVVAPPVERVRYADLNLLSDAGVEQLGARIRHAAHKLCVEDTVKPLATKLAERACFEGALADGLEQADQLVASQREQASAAGATIIIRTR